jgi:hypothetical protein
MTHVGAFLNRSKFDASEENGAEDYVLDSITSKRAVGDLHDEYHMLHCDSSG